MVEEKQKCELSNDSGNETKFWTGEQTVLLTIGIILFAVNFVLCCKKGFSFLFSKGVILFFVSILLIAIPCIIYSIKQERAIPPEIRASIKSRLLRYHGEDAEEEKYRQEREIAERRFDILNSLIWYHILFGRKK